ncbi:glycosyltransferase family 1 protein [Nostoc sp. CALU 1950]|uniref:glycosyltransferase family 1 protein n=1 Tax=Nostoc sp. CALU 1950 TaxID=3104321 RepID=UPI003EBB7F09
MTSEKSQVKNNSVSNVISPKQRKTKRSQLPETQSSSPSRLNLTSSNKKVQSTKTFKDTPDIVCLSHLRWNFVYQRPQHLLSRCAQGKRVFFIEEPIFSEEPLARLDINEDSNGVVVVVPHLPQGLSEEATNADLQLLIDSLFAEHNISKYICWYYTPMAIAFTRRLQPQAVVYDCMDELSAFQGASPTLKNYEAELFSRADLVFTGGQSLYESKVNQHPNVYAFPSSVDVAHFGQARNVQEPEDQAHIPHPRLGFFGVIDERMDIELLAGIAEARPDWHLVIIGPVVKIDPANLPQHENIHYLGGRDYKQLPAYLAGWDLAMLPFARNESTRFISPTKTPEYLAAGRPVVSTSIRDVVRPYGESKLVQIADTISEFVAAAEQAMQEDTPASEWLSRVDTFLEKISWDRTWASMMKLIDSAIAARDGEDKAKGFARK